MKAQVDEVDTFEIEIEDMEAQGNFEPEGNIDREKIRQEF